MKYHCINLVVWTFASTQSSKLYYHQLEFREPGFDFTQLDKLGEEIENSTDCPGVHHVVTSYRYPMLEDGEVVNETITIMSSRTDYVKEEIFLETNGHEAATLLGEKIIQPHLNCKQQDDSELIRIVKDQYLDPPSLLPYNFKDWKVPTADGQAMMLDHRYFQEMVQGGFFIEAGAFDGYSDSTTLYLELRHKWSGLLVEPLMKEYSELRRYNRKAWSVNTCLSPESRPATIQFSLSMSSNSTIFGIVKEGTKADTTEMQCLPLSTMILALGNPRVDFLSLDIEGAEFDVLKNLLWDRIDIRAISVETQFADEFDVSLQELDDLLTAQGFQFLDRMSRDSVYVQIPRPDLMLPRKNLAVQSRKVGGRELLLRDHYPFPRRLCQMFLVPRGNLARHCRLNYPLDYFRDRDVMNLPPCITSQQCPNNKKVLELNVNCPRAPLQTLLSDGCNLVLHDRKDKERTR